MKTPLSTWISRWVECRLTATPFSDVKRAYDKAAAHAVPVEWKDLFTHRMAGGRLDSLVDGMIFAKERNVKMSFVSACASELYARAKFQLCLTDYLKPLIESGIDDISKAHYGDL